MITWGPRAALAAALCLATTGHVSQAPAGQDGPPPRFSAAVEVVEVYAAVTGVSGAPLTGLRRDDFSVAEDGVPQAITVFAEGEFPLALAVAVDRSWSMAGRPLDLARAAARALLAGLRPEDEATVVAVSGRVETVAPLSRNRADALDAVGRLDPWSTTALRDALIVAIDRIQAGRGRRALVVLSDGADRYSEASVADVLQHARASGVIVYPVAVGKARPPLFVELASLTGGHSFEGRDERALNVAMRDIVEELRHQYLIGYAPASPGAPGWHSIRIGLSVPGAHVRARDGYLRR